VPSWLGCRAPQDHVNHGSWCIGRLGAASLDGCSRAVNVDSLPQSSYPSFPPKDRDSTLTGLHQGRNVAATDLSASSGARGEGERALGEENLDRWAHAETTVPDWWGQKDTGTHWH
jgi:hypothetical protein